jgi:hypothetical protein
MDKARERLIIEQCNEKIAQYARDLRKQAEQQIGRKVGYDPKSNKLRLSAFHGSSRVPLELLRAYLAHRDRVETMTVADRHANLLLIALQAIQATGETVPARIWHDRLERYQIEPMHRLLQSYGYSPAAVDNTLTKMRKLVRAGKPQSVGQQAYTFGTGERAVTFAAGRQATYRGDTRTVQVSGERYRVKIDGKLVSLWTWLKDSVAVQDRPTVIAMMRQADHDAAARKIAVEITERCRSQQTEQRAAIEATLDTFDVFAPETPSREPN